jgi:hypothetical protein
MKQKHIDMMYNEHIDIVQGTKGYIKRILKVRGCSDATINEVMEKIEAIIEHSGKLGRAIQRDKDEKYIKEANTKIWEMQCKMYQ